MLLLKTAISQSKTIKRLGVLGLAATLGVA
jgi:hypothetical protein